MGCTRDILGDYRLTTTVTESEILRAAEEILARKFNRGEPLSDPTQAGAMLKMRLAHLDHEVFTVIFLDTRHHVLAIEDLFRGSLTSCEVHPREIARRALELNAGALIVSHGHPSGSPEPSAADRAVTARLKQALALFDVRLLDHIVVGGTAPPVSLAARGWL